MRRVWTVIHRWAGLTMAGFLIIVGLTGSLLAFLPELERALNPQFYPRQNTGEPLGLAQLVERAEERAPEATVNGVMLRDYANRTFALVSPKAAGQALGFNQLFLDPYTGEELGRRQAGVISEGRVNLMPFLYQLHYSLALGTVGIWVLGICALIWTLDCFVGFYLTLPPGRNRCTSFGFLPPARGKVRKGVEERGEAPRSPPGLAARPPARGVCLSGAQLP
ncbi:PepSY-associated TM helix domain-containing protein [Nitrosococcus oceani]|uniref:PepSY-associated TM helix domain-containing protein n=1 Tax=Nitrosococcus oceani TaxID=1229 RepID=UPI00068C948B|nr:PepSY domain-containing protein [Nitrosococcus oceani]